MKGIVRRSSIAGLCVALLGASAFAGVPAVPPDSNPFGGAVDQGSPALDLTAALWQAGGGTGDFSTRSALVSMLGRDGADAEIAKLTRRYGTTPVRKWLEGSDWLMSEGLTQLRNTGTDLPQPSSGLTGTKLAAALVGAGIAPGDSRFRTGYYYDHLFSHAVNKVMETGMDRKFSERYVKDVFTINNQAMYDVSQSVHGPDVQLATLH